VYSPLTLTEQLRVLGIRAGRTVMVHVSMRKVGVVEGGASGLLNALRESLSPAGNLLMVLGAADDTPFDALHSKVDIEDMGVLAEVFRTFSGVLVTDHAAARFAALGPAAAQLLHPTPLHDYHGPGSVLERLVACDGWVLSLGAHRDRITLTHYAEYLADVPSKRRVRRRYLRADIGEQWIESLDDDHGIVTWPEGDYFPQIFVDYCAAGRARIGPVGDCTAELFSAQDFVAYAVRWMQQNLGAAASVPPKLDS
jgi:aminoglycoside N3'-acetyltransferase